LNAEQGRCSSWRLLAYGGFGLPWSLAGLPILVYLPAFYAQELHLSVGLVGAVFLSARLWDGFADVFAGWLSDRSKSQFGRRKPWVVLGAPFLMISTWFLCNPPDGAGLAYLALWAGLFYSAFAVVGIPYLSWGSELATEYGERSRITAFRETFTMLGNLFFAAGPLIFLAADAPLHEVLFLICITVVVLVPLTVLPLGFAVRDPPQTGCAESHLIEGLTVLAKDRAFVLFVLATLCMWISNGVGNSLAVFSFNVGLELPDKLFATIFIIYVSALCALPLTMRLARRMEKHHLLAATLALQAAANGVLIWVPMGNFPIVAAAWIVVGVASSAFFVLPTSMLADIIDNGEAIEGQRRSGAYMAIYNLVMKIGLALGVGLSFGSLALVSYDPNAAQYGPADVRNIRLLAFGLPALLLVLTAILFLRHPITRKVQQQLRAQIDARQSASQCL
jgi:glycoside/pentoside/hexuronide:cation symporter, GPH family